MTATASQMKKSKSLRELADKMQADIDSAFAPREINTRRKLDQAKSTAKKGADLALTQIALLEISALIQLGEGMGEFTSKSAVLKSVQRRDIRVRKYVDLDLNVTPLEVGIRFERAEILLKGVKDLFPTPENMLLEIVPYFNIEEGMTILEPSAGLGNIAEFIQLRWKVAVDCIESNYDARAYLEKKKFNLVGDDFLQFEAVDRYDRIIMNPPFSHDDWAVHIVHAWRQLKPTGRLISIVPNALTKKSKKVQAVRDLMESFDHQILKTEVDFSTGERKTGTSTKILILDKPASKPVIVELGDAPPVEVTKSEDGELVPVVPEGEVLLSIGGTPLVEMLENVDGDLIPHHTIDGVYVRVENADVLRGGHVITVDDPTYPHPVAVEDVPATEEEPPAVDEVVAVIEPPVEDEPKRRVFQIGPTRVVENPDMVGKPNEDIRGILMGMYPEIKDADIREQVQADAQGNPVLMVQFKPKAGRRG